MNLVKTFEKMSKEELAVLVACLEEAKGEGLKQFGLHLVRSISSSRHKGLKDPLEYNDLFGRVRYKALSFNDDFDKEMLIDRLKRSLRRSLALEPSTSDEFLSSKMIEVACLEMGHGYEKTNIDMLDLITKDYFDKLLVSYRKMTKHMSLSNEARAAFKLASLHSLSPKRKELLMRQFQYGNTFDLDCNILMHAISRNKSTEAIGGWGEYEKAKCLNEARVISYALESSYCDGFGCSLDTESTKVIANSGLESSYKAGADAKNNEAFVQTIDIITNRVCPECRNVITERAMTFCPKCGTSLKNAREYVTANVSEPAVTEVSKPAIEEELISEEPIPDDNETIMSYIHLFIGFGSQFIVHNTVKGVITQIVWVCSCKNNEPYKDEYERKKHLCFIEEEVDDYNGGRGVLASRVNRSAYLAASIEKNKSDLVINQQKYNAILANEDYEGKIDDLYDLKILIAELEKTVDEDTLLLKSEMEKIDLLRQDVISTIRVLFLNYYPNILISDEQVMNIYVKCDYFLLTKVEMFFIELLESTDINALADTTEGNGYVTTLDYYLEHKSIKLYYYKLTNDKFRIEVKE